MRKPEDDYDRLIAKASNCRDNARAELLVADAFKEEYLDGLSVRLKDAGLTAEEGAVKHSRSLSIYDFYIGGQHRAKDFIADAELFERAAAAIRSRKEVSP